MIRDVECQKKFFRLTCEVKQARSWRGGCSHKKLSPRRRSKRSLTPISNTTTTTWPSKRRKKMSASTSKCTTGQRERRWINGNNDKWPMRTCEAAAACDLLARLRWLTQSIGTCPRLQEGSKEGRQTRGPDPIP